LNVEGKVLVHRLRQHTRRPQYFFSMRTWRDVCPWLEIRLVWTTATSRGWLISLCCHAAVYSSTITKSTNNDDHL